MEWTTFWDSYESSIHRNTQLSDIDKFIYLSSLLEGPAAESISGLRLTAANCNEAVSILQRRFGNTQQIVSKHMEALLNIEVVTPHCNLKALRHLHDVVEAQIRGLKALGVPAESYGSLLAPVILGNAPTADNNIHPIHASQLLIHLSRSKFFKGQGDVLFA